MPNVPSSIPATSSIPLLQGKETEGFDTTKRQLFTFPARPSSGAHRARSRAGSGHDVGGRCDAPSMSTRPPLAFVAIRFATADGRELVLESDARPSSPIRVPRGELDLIDAGTRETLLVGVRRALAWEAHTRESAIDHGDG